ncbi:MAG: nucleotide exchange factor GrpE [Candidatus Lokiarchaeota archaeon]|nr:nucleotide exchange factor GrpE [Candidatus Lokiarchaeota archaeon]
MADDEQKAAASKAAPKAGEGAKETAACSPPPPSPEERIKGLEDLLKQRDKKIGELEADLKWARADFENYRKSTERRMDADKEAMHGRLMKDFLPFFDTFDKAMQAAKDIADQNGGMSDPLKKFFGGLSSLYKGLNDLLASRNLKRIDPLGKKFDYNYHEVMMQAEDPALPEDTVVQVIQQGWLLNGKVLRPAMVAVSRKPAKKAEVPAADIEPAPETDDAAAEGHPGNTSGSK